MNNRVRRLLFILVIISLVVVLALVINFVYQKLTKASINISSPYSTVRLVDSGGILIGEGYGKYSGRVSPGDYTISVDSNVENVYERVVSLEANKSYTFEVDSIEVSNSEILLKADSAAYYATSDQFYTLNKNGEAITLGSDQADIYNIGQQIKQAKLYGLATGYFINIASNLYSISNTNINLLRLPSDLNKGLYQITTNLKGDLLAYDNKAVYLYQNGQFKSIYKVNSENSNIYSPSLSSENIFLLEETKNDTEKISRVFRLDLGGNILSQIEFKSLVDEELREDNQDKAITDNIDLYSSPSGEKLALKNNKKLFIYDSNLSSYQIIGVDFVQNIFWTNNNDLFFSEGDKIYQYNSEDSSSRVLTLSPFNKSISSIFVVDEKIYYSSFNTTNKPVIMKAGIGADNNSLKEESDLIVSNLNNQEGQCKLLYTNYSRSTIYVNNPSQECYNIVDNLIKKYSLNKNNIDIKNNVW